MIGIMHASSRACYVNYCTLTELSSKSLQASHNDVLLYDFVSLGLDTLYVSV